MNLTEIRFVTVVEKLWKIKEIYKHEVGISFNSFTLFYSKFISAKQASRINSGIKTT